MNRTGPSLATIGVYGFSAESFLAGLGQGGVGLVLDVRQRRGVRGSQYAWANSARLQNALAAAGIAYEHHRELAPTTELRQLQYAENARQGVGKRLRAELAPEYVRRYTAEILDAGDLEALADSLPGDRAPRCSAWSATPRPAIARSSRPGWRTSTASRWSTCGREPQPTEGPLAFSATPAAA